MNADDDLRGTLRRHAEGMGTEQPFTLDDVRRRAQGIRRRRIAVAGLAAAAVLAVAVPFGVSVADRLSGEPALDPAAPVPSETLAPPADPTDVLLTTDRPVGEVPAGIDYAYDGRIRPAGGDPVEVGSRYLELARLGDGWVGLRNRGLATALDFIDSDGTVSGSTPALPGLVTTPDGTVVAYGAPGGRLMTVTAGGTPREVYQGTGALRPVAVTGSESCDLASDGGGCVVYSNRERGGDNFTVASDGTVADVPGVLTLTGVSTDGRVVGITSYDDTSGVCSALVAPDGERAWETCDFTLDAFSPDGRYVLGLPAMRDGAGDSSVAILDAESGRVLARASSNLRTQAFASTLQWDTNSTVLMPVWQDGTWALMRLTPEGLLVRVEARDFDYPAEPYVSDLTLQVGP